jgi:hypothetical protein
MSVEEWDPMLRLLVGTCVWLDVAKDHRQEQTLSVLEELIRLGEVSLMVPTVVLAEYDRHKARIVDESRRSLSTVFKRVKEAVDRFGDPMTKGSVLQHLNEVDHQIPLLGEAAARSVVRIEKLLSHLVLREKIMLGQVKIVDCAEAAHQQFSNNVIAREVWEGALKSAKQVEQRFGRAHLGPYSAFDWGMMNGKLSALRWFLGEEWDELYT